MLMFQMGTWSIEGFISIALCSQYLSNLLFDKIWRGGSKMFRVGASRFSKVKKLHTSFANLQSFAYICKLGHFMHKRHILCV
jgi:hypothetical protein